MGKKQELAEYEKDYLNRLANDGKPNLENVNNEATNEAEIEEKLADKAEPILGFRPSSKIKRGRIGIIISIICLVYVIIELIKSGVIDI